MRQREPPFTRSQASDCAVGGPTVRADRDEMAERIRILLVEDDRDLAFVTQAALQMEGLDVTVAHDGQEGLEAADRVRPDVVITDLIMPVLDGLELIQKLLAQQAPSPVIAVSAVGSRLRAARELGAVEALVKPVAPKELAACARKVFRRTRSP